jgi:hypothetical protein
MSKTVVYSLVAAQALVVLHAKEAVPYLISAMAPAGKDERIALADTLHTLTGRDLGPYPDDWQRWWATNLKLP